MIKGSYQPRRSRDLRLSAKDGRAAPQETPPQSKQPATAGPAGGTVGMVTRQLIGFMPFGLIPFSSPDIVILRFAQEEENGMRPLFLLSTLNGPLR